MPPLPSNCRTSQLPTFWPTPIITPSQRRSRIGDRFAHRRQLVEERKHPHRDIVVAALMQSPFDQLLAGIEGRVLGENPPDRLVVDEVGEPVRTQKEAVSLL